MENVEGEGEAVLTEEDLIQQSLDDYDAGKYSPKLLGMHELPMDTHMVDADEDMQKLMMARQQLQVTGKRNVADKLSSNFWTFYYFLNYCLPSQPHLFSLTMNIET